MHRDPHVHDSAGQLATRISIETIAVGNTPRLGYESMFHDYGRIRGRVYALETGMIPLDDLNPDGTEFDEYDRHAVHVAAIERIDDSVGRGRVVGSTRIIVDAALGTAAAYEHAGLQLGRLRLPIDDHFAEFGDVIDLRDGIKRCEVSRLIARHERKDIQSAISAALYRATAQHMINLGLDEAFAVVERPLAAVLRRGGIPVRRVTRSLFLEKYGSVNFGVSIDLELLAERFEIEADLDRIELPALIV